MSERAPQVRGSSAFALQEGNTEETWEGLIARGESSSFLL
jgi:hypothetical protein